MADILFVDGSRDLAVSVSDALASDWHLATTPDVSALPGLLQSRPIAEVVFGPSVEPSEALAGAQQILDSGLGVAVVVVAAEVTTQLLRQALRAGVYDVVPATEHVEEIAGVIREAAAGAPARVAPADRGSVVTLLSTKGGVGKSVLASNLAVALVQMGKSVVLADLDLRSGDIGIMLQMPPEKTITHVAESFDRLDPAMLRGFLTPHSSGLLALLAPVQPEHAEALDGQHVGPILSMLRGLADFVVVDTPAVLDDVVLSALDESDLVYAVTTPDVASVKNTKVALQKLRQLGYDGRKVRVVLNRSNSSVLLDTSDVKRAIECELAGMVPSDRAVPRSVNKGVPIVVDSPRSPVGRSITALAEAMIRTGRGATGRVA